MCALSCLPWDDDANERHEQTPSASSPRGDTYGDAGLSSLVSRMGGAGRYTGMFSWGINLQVPLRRMEWKLTWSIASASVAITLLEKSTFVPVSNLV